MKEIWKDIVIEKNGVVYDYTGLYQVSNLGKVRSLDRIDSRGNKVKGRILKPGIDSRGYQIVGLCKNGKAETFQVHRLVATAFIPNPENLPVVNHKDENPLNNCIDNLEWCTQGYNVQYSAKPLSEETKQKISKTKKGKPKSAEWKQKINKKVICLETKQVFNSIGEANKWCNCNISHHLRGNTKSAGKHPETGEKLHWQYYED